jgi:hypothetical protein
MAGKNALSRAISAETRYDPDTWGAAQARIEGCAVGVDRRYNIR